MPKFLIIQTAFIGDVILATGLIESIHDAYPDAEIHFLLRKGNASLLQGHPYISKIICWDKRQNKFSGLLEVIKEARKNHYDFLINVQRFFSSGLISACCKAGQKIGFDKNPLAVFYDKKTKHVIGNGHETERNFNLIRDIPGMIYVKPKLYPDNNDKVLTLIHELNSFYCFAPASVWFTKQLPLQKWIQLANQMATTKTIFLLGSPSDRMVCENIKKGSDHPNIKIVCGELSLLESAALMQHAEMNFVNDSAPMHLASAVNAPVTAFFCSTVPLFGFGPLSDHSVIRQTTEELTCRPCGLHGYKQCPRGHFRCATSIAM